MVRKNKQHDIGEWAGIKVGDKAIVWRSSEPGKNHREIVVIDRITYPEEKFWSNGWWYCYAKPLTKRNLNAYKNHLMSLKEKTKE